MRVARLACLTGGLRRYRFALSAEVRPQDATVTLGSVALNPRGRRLVWDFFVERFDRVNSVFNTGGQAFLMSGLVDEVASAGTTTEDVRCGSVTGVVVVAVGARR
jgi:hypothetical protein